MNIAKKIILGVGILALGTLGFLSSIEAYRGDPNVIGPNYSKERHTAMQNAFETNNYNNWKELMQNRGKISQVITAENFSKFSEIYMLTQSGNLEEAQKIRKELGLGLRDGSGQKIMKNGLVRGINRGLNQNN